MQLPGYNAHVPHGARLHGIRCNMFINKNTNSVFMSHNMFCIYAFEIIFNINYVINKMYARRKRSFFPSKNVIQ